MQETIGQRILAAVISYQLGISVDRARKLYVAGREIDPSWEAVGAELLRNFSGCEATPPARSEREEKKHAAT
jgi:hypothetical protein